MPKVGYKQANEHRAKISKSHLGVKHSEKSRRNMSKAHMGIKHSIEHRKRTSEGHIGLNHTRVSIMKMSRIKMGHLITEETKRKISKTLMGRTGRLCPNWRGGISSYPPIFNEQLKKVVRECNDFICQICFKKQKGKRLDVHHIDYDKDNCCLDNLVSLCHSCHSETGTNREAWKRILGSKCE